MDSVFLFRTSPLHFVRSKNNNTTEDEQPIWYNTLMGTLFIVGTPIGNLQDISIRAVKTLFTADIIACEDTRRAGLLLSKLEPLYMILLEGSNSIPPKPRLLSYYDAIETERIGEIIPLLQSGHNVVLISDAGMPTVSDPGFKLIRACIAEKVPVEVIPGPSAVLTALAVSGLPSDKFLFVGYPPHKPGHRISFYESILETQQLVKSTVIFFEAPHKLLKTLEEMQSVFGNREIVICRELTKIHEEIRREAIGASIAHFAKQSPKGEFVLLINFSSTGTK